MVSRNFADLNGLGIGDTLVLYDVNTADEELNYGMAGSAKPPGSNEPKETVNVDAEPMRLTICGIYMDITMPQPDGSDWAVNNRRNEILTSFSTLEEQDARGLRMTAVYYLKNPGLAGEFESYVRQNGLHEIYNVNVDADSYNRIVQPVEGLKGVATSFLAVILAVGGIILILLSMLGVRERKYEIGVLRAAGMPKTKVALVLLNESICVMAVCLCVGLGLGLLAAQPVSDSILARQAALVEQLPKESHGEILADSGMETEEVQTLREVKVVPEPDSILFVILSALALGTLTNATGIFYIARYEPMRILRERN